MKTLFRTLTVVILGCACSVACGDDDDDGGADGTGNVPNRPEETGAACEDVSDCFPEVVEGELQGDAICLARVRDGYCTHTCTADEDCCAATGECKTDLKQVCSPFESTGDMMCFLSCEDEDVAAAPDVADEQEYCQREASPDFICRSSGGGSANRKICVPGDCGIGADCASDADCDGDLTCVTGFTGGYCTQVGCSLNADCPADSVCVTSPGNDNYCARTCSSAGDCSFCRHDGFFATCSDEVVFAEDGTAETVCVPPS
jgi:hypothetical protein